MVSHSMVVQFMDYVQNHRDGRGGDISPRTYNNYIKNGSAFFTWMIDKCYCKENHFQKIKSKTFLPSFQKKRIFAGRKFVFENTEI